MIDDNDPDLDPAAHDADKTKHNFLNSHVEGCRRPLVRVNPRCSQEAVAMAQSLSFPLHSSSG